MLALMGTGCKEKATEPAPVPTVRQYSIEQFLDNESVFGSSFSPDGRRVLVSSNRTGIFNAYTVATAGGDLVPVTTSDSSSIFAVSYFPTDERMLFRMDNNGNEEWQLYVRDTEGQIEALTAVAGARAVFYGWAHDSESFYMGWSKRDARFMDVYEVAISDLTPKLIYEMKSGDNFNGISPDERYMAITRPINTNDSELLLWDRTDRKMTKLSQKKAAYSVADFAPDSTGLYYLTDEGSEFSYLVRYNFDDKSREKVAERKWDISYAYFSQEGTYQVIGTNEDGKTVVQLSNREGSPVTLPDYGRASVTNIDIARNEQQMAFYVSSSASPSDLYVYDFATGKQTRLTNTLNSAIDPKDLVEAEVVRFKSFDGEEIPAIYYKPRQAVPTQTVPALVSVHGGPGGQSTQSYSGVKQYLVNHGYAVLDVNNRGSSGYGKTFYRMDDKRHGEEDLKDCIAGKEWLARQAYVDSTKIGIMGGSYGGYMVMRAMTHTPDEFAVGVNLYGVTNWVRTLRSIPPWWDSFKTALYEEMGDPNTGDSVRHRAISPLFHADQVQHPVIILQGAQDPRVLKVESDEMVTAIQAKGVPVEYVLFDDEGHGFVKKENQVEAYSRILQFLDEYLRGKPKG